MIAKTRNRLETPVTRPSSDSSANSSLLNLQADPREHPALKDNLRLNWFIVATLVVGAVLVMPFDVWLAKFFMSDPFPGELRSLIHKTEFFGHAYGILGIAFTIYLLCEGRRRELPRLLCTALVAGLVCDVVKVIFHRVRPCDFSFAAGESTFKGISFLHAETFGQLFDSSLHSFPSAHTGVAVAFAMTLGVMFPKAAKWFLVLAAMCAVSRFDGGAHFVSDTLIGGAIGYVVAIGMLHWKSLERWIDAFMRRITLGSSNNKTV